MPTTIPPARFDLPWKTVITHALRAFMHFFFAEIATQIDWRQRARFRDKEFAGIGFGTTPDSMVADKLVEVCLRHGSAPSGLIHIEVQAQRTASLPSRIFDYNNRIAKEHDQPVCSLVLLADDDPNWRPQAFHRDLLGTLTGFSYPVAKLLDYATSSEELEASDNPFALLTLAHWHTQQSGHDGAARYAAKLRLTKLLYQHQWSQKRIITMFKAINWMMTLPETHQRRYWQAVLQFAKERNMTTPIKWITPLEEMFISDGRSQGLKEGLEKGLERGRREGAATLLERQIERRFGPLSKTRRHLLASASMDQLAAWSDALPEARSLKQVFQ